MNLTPTNTALNNTLVLLHVHVEKDQIQQQSQLFIKMACTTWINISIKDATHLQDALLFITLQWD